MTESVYTRAIENVVRAVSEGGGTFIGEAVSAALAEGLIVYLPVLPTENISEPALQFALTDMGLELLQSMNERRGSAPEAPKEILKFVAEAESVSHGILLHTPLNLPGGFYSIAMTPEKPWHKPRMPTGLEPSGFDCGRSDCKSYDGSGCILHSPPLTLPGACLSYQPLKQGPVPSWGDLPDWVEYIAQDSAGKWYGYGCKPWPSMWMWLSGTTTHFITSGKFNPSWKDTLQSRPAPESEPLCPVCGRPVSTHHRGLCCCPYCDAKDSAFLRHIPETYIWCSYCGARSEGGGTEEKETALWNRRSGQ